MLDEKIELIKKNLADAAGHIKQIETTMAALEKAGMYPTVPHFQYQDRNGSGEYLYLLFRQNHDGSYQGPGGKRKIYIGSDQKKKDEARLMAYRREVWEELKTAKLTLHGWIITNEAKITRLEAEVSRYVLESDKYPRCKLPEVL